MSITKFVDASVAWERQNNVWPSIIIPKSDIEREIERLASAERSGNGRRESLIVHPFANESYLGLAPGVDVTLSVLLPGETSAPRRLNASQVAICIKGKAVTHVRGEKKAISRLDVWTMPAMQVHTIENNGNELFACLIYSNAPLLRNLEVLYVEEEIQLPEGWDAVAKQKASGEPKVRAKDLVPPITLKDGRAQLLAYEHLVDPDFVESVPLHWSYEEVLEHLNNVRELGKKYTGRRLYILYNPATEKRNGTTHSFFASMASYGPDIRDIPHRHASASINYIMKGSGTSKIGGKTLSWEEGDLHFSAPSWSIHAHSSGPNGFETLTIQDHPFHIANDSLIWQETLTGPVLSLGSEVGFQTNLEDVKARG